MNKEISRSKFINNVIESLLLHKLVKKVVHLEEEEVLIIYSKPSGILGYVSLNHEKILDACEIQGVDYVEMIASWEKEGVALANELIASLLDTPDKYFVEVEKFVVIDEYFHEGEEVKLFLKFYDSTSNLVHQLPVENDVNKMIESINRNSHRFGRRENVEVINQFIRLKENWSDLVLKPTPIQPVCCCGAHQDGSDTFKYLLMLEKGVYKTQVKKFKGIEDVRKYVVSLEPFELINIGTIDSNRVMK